MGEGGAGAGEAGGASAASGVNGAKRSGWADMYCVYRNAASRPSCERAGWGGWRVRLLLNTGKIQEGGSRDRSRSRQIVEIWQEAPARERQAARLARSVTQGRPHGCRMNQDNTISEINKH